MFIPCEKQVAGAMWNKEADISRIKGERVEKNFLG